MLLETSGRVGQVGLAQGPQLCGTRRLDEARRHARDLAPAVAGLLAEQGWTPRSLAAVLVSRGPGSYTGLRVGIMSAKTFAYTTGCALVAVPTFAAIAQQAPPEAARVEVIADAQQDKIYVECFVRTESSLEWQSECPLRIQTLADWLAQRPPDIWVTGPGLHVYASRLPATLGVTAAPTWDPRLESILAIGLARFAAGQRDNLWTLEPLYLRPSAAEEKWKARGSS